MRRWTVYIVTAVCFVSVVRGAPTCTTVCSVGQYCSGAECLPCPPGTFQTDAAHFYFTCKSWTMKLPGSHYVLVKNGTATSDAVWHCEDGYREREYTVGGFECVEVETTSSSTPASGTQVTTAESTPTTEPTTASLLPQQQREGLSDGGIAAVIIGLLIGIALTVGIVVFVRYKRRPRDDQHRLNGTNGGTVETFTSLQLDSPTESEPLTQNPDNINYKFCLKFVEKLEVDKFKSFLNVLYDPSGKFRAEIVLQSESSKTRDVNEYLVQSFLRYVKFNNGIYRSLIVIALDDIGRHYILEEIENLVPSFKYNNSENTAVMEYVRALGAGNETTSSMGRKVLRQDRFRLFYYLTDQILLDNLIKLLRQLPGSSNRFNAYNYYKGRLHEEEGYNAFAQTLEEWWLQNSEWSLKDVITEFLKDEERQDLLANRELQNHLHRIAPAETSSTDHHGQEQYHFQSSVSDEINTCQESDITETEHLLNDTDREHTSDSTAGNQVLNNSEGELLSSNSERGHLSINSEGDHLSNNSEGHNLSINSERDHLSNNSEGHNLSNNSEGGHLLNNTERGHLSDTSDGAPLSTNNPQRDRRSNTNRRVQVLA